MSKVDSQQTWLGGYSAGSLQPVANLSQQNNPRIHMRSSENTKNLTNNWNLWTNIMFRMLENNIYIIYIFFTKILFIHLGQMLRKYLVHF